MRQGLGTDGFVRKYRVFLAVRLMGGAGLLLAGCAPDYLAGKMTGRQCSAGYVEQGEDWCAPPERPPAPQPYCTQSWNGVDCWSRPDLMPNVARQAAGGPTGLTQDQNANRQNLSVDKIVPTNSYTP